MESGGGCLARVIEIVNELCYRMRCRGREWIERSDDHRSRILLGEHRVQFDTDHPVTWIVVNIRSETDISALPLMRGDLIGCVVGITLNGCVSS